METNQYLDDDAIESLIAKVLAGEADAAEMAALDAWRNSSAENESYYLILKQIFDESPNAKESYAYDVDAAWNKVKPNPVFICALPNPEKKVIEKSFPWVRIAAAILIFAGLSFATYRFLKEENTNPLHYAATETILETSLADSTHIVLNRNSKITVAYTKSQRRVSLSGEAFFDIAPDSKRQFILDAGNLTIEDIGTSFNVNAPESADSVVVFVESGEVKLTSSSGKVLNLVHGEKGIYKRSSDEFVLDLESDTNLVSYKTKIFVFENAALEVVVAKLNEVYGVNIVISESLQNCHLTTTFRNEKIEAILDVIAETLNLKQIKSDNKIILEGVSCIPKED